VSDERVAESEQKGQQKGGESVVDEWRCGSERIVEVATVAQRSGESV
jgi:hypothetical protein